MTYQKKSNNTTPLYRKVNNVRFHSGVQIGVFVKNSLDRKANNVDMTMTPVGVHIKYSNGGEWVVPYGNIYSFELVVENSSESRDPDAVGNE